MLSIGSDIRIFLRLSRFPPKHQNHWIRTNTEQVSNKVQQKSNIFVRPFSCHCHRRRRCCVTKNATTNTCSNSSSVIIASPSVSASSNKSINVGPIESARTVDNLQPLFFLTLCLIFYYCYWCCCCSWHWNIFSNDQKYIFYLKSIKTLKLWRCCFFVWSYRCIFTELFYGPSSASSIVYFRSLQTNIAIFTTIYEKNVHPVSGTGI